MSQVVKRNRNYLHCLVYCPSHQRKFLLDSATPEQVHAIVQAVHNLSHGFVSVSPENSRTLTSFNEHLKKLQDPEIPYKEKKKILVQEGGSFIPDVLSTFLGGLLLL